MSMKQVIVTSFAEFSIMDHLLRFYVQQAGVECGYNRVGPIYIYPSFLQRGLVIGSFFGGLFRAVRPILWSSAKDFGKATLRPLGDEALRTGGRILTGIADYPTISPHDIISKNVTKSLQNLSSKMRGQGRKRKRRVTLRKGKKLNVQSGQLLLHRENDVGQNEPRLKKETSFLKRH
jgi:hypothetical protein